MNVPVEIAKNMLMALPPVRSRAMLTERTGMNGDMLYAFAVWKRIEKLLPQDAPRKSLLELGPGQTPQLLRSAQTQNTERCIAVDIEAYPGVKEAFESSGIEFRTYDGRKLPVDDASVDLIFSKDVFEHLRYPGEIVSECYRTLKPGGYMYARIDMRDHYTTDESRFFDNLRYNRRVWDLMT